MSPSIAVDLKKRKHSGDQDTVTIRGEVTRVFKAWDQALLPHEAVHFVVEEVFGLVGFVRLTAAGVSSEQMIEEKDPEAMAAEALTNAFQYELFGMAESGNDALRQSLAQMFTHATGAQPRVSDAQLDDGRQRLSELVAAWAGVGPGEHLVLDLSAR